MAITNSFLSGDDDEACDIAARDGNASEATHPRPKKRVRLSGPGGVFKDATAVFEGNFKLGGCFCRNTKNSHKHVTSCKINFFRS